MGHMKTISIRELHEQTGQWVRGSSQGEIYITDRGCLVAKMMPLKPLPQTPFFANPPLRAPFSGTAMLIAAEPMRLRP